MFFINTGFTYILFCVIIIKKIARFTMNIEQKKLQGIINSSTVKRYKNFINTVVDTEMVWLLDGGDGYCTVDDENGINIIVYPTKEFADLFSFGAKPVMMDIHEFCEQCKEMFDEENIAFAVSPNEQDAMQVSPQMLYNDLLDALREIEDID